MDNNQLYHYGVLGMRWGRRKNRTTVRKSKKKSKSITPSDDAKEAANLKKKNPMEMSNAELRKLNERKMLMQNYSKLNPGKIKKGLAFITAAVGIMNTVSTVYNTSNSIVKIGKEVGQKFVKSSGDINVGDLIKPGK